MGNEPKNRWTSAARWSIVGVAAMLVFAACVPPVDPGPTTTTTTTIVTEPVPPQVQSFSVHGSVQPAPSVVTLSWNVTDANHDELTCRIDGDGDGSFELTVEDCRGTGSRNVSIESPGQVTAQLEVSDDDFAPVGATTTFTVGAGTAEPFDIELRGLDELEPAVADAFTQAVDRWERIITRGLPDYTPTTPTPGCLPDDVDPLPAVVDDLIIDVSTPEIDGPGEILGQAGPTCVLIPPELPFHGVMEFDADDVADMVANGTLVDVIEHEMGHVLGVGTLWDMSWSSSGVRRLLSGAASSNPTFTGAAAVAELSVLGRSGAVPVENSGSAGTRDSHWRETTFGNELMTGYISYGSNPLSRMTIASLADMGYQVDLDEGDPYVLTTGAALRQAPRPHGEMIRPPVGVG